MSIMNHEPSKYQIAVFNAITNSKNNIVVDAKAGSGKTTTIVHALHLLPENLKTIFVAYNKKIAVELEKRVPKNIQVSTLHSLGYKIIQSHMGKVSLDIDKRNPETNGESKNIRIVQSLVGTEKEKTQLRYELCKTISLCKGYLAEDQEQIKEVIYRHGVETDPLSENEFIQTVIQSLKIAANQTKLIDFDDMLWFVKKFNLKIPNFDFVFVDEAQDLNRVQLEIVMGLCEKGRMCAVLDPRQAIYQFRGADEKACEEIIERTKAKVLPLSVSYRCPKKVIELAQTIVPEIEAAPNAIEGEVIQVKTEEMLKNAGPGDFIISRVNAPLVKYCLHFLKERRKANIQGRDIGKTLIYMIVRSKATNVNEFLEWLENWKNLECERLTARNKNCDYIIDRYECLLTFAEGTNSLNEMKKNIEELFDDNDDNNRIILTTSHRSKGIERCKTWILTNTFKKGKSKEEDNILYVAYTRAKEKMYLVKD